MLLNYLKVALKVLARRKFFTFISLFGVGFTLLVLTLAAAAVDHMLWPSAPEVNRSRTLVIDEMAMEGEKIGWNGPPGYGFLDRYCRGLDGAERMAIVNTGEAATSYIDGERVELTLRRTDGEYWNVLEFSFLEGSPYTDEDDRAARPVAVISESTRRRMFGEGVPALGRRLELSGQSFEVVGVVANVGRTYNWGYGDVWAPIGTIADPGYRREIMGSFHGLVLAGSRSDFSRIKDDFASRLPHVEFPSEEWTTLRGAPMTQLELLAAHTTGRSSAGAIAGMLAIWVGTAIAFMLLPAVNLVNINISRIFERTTEIGVRRAFGASSANLVIQFVFENVVLCVVGGIVAFVLSGVVIQAINASGLVPNAAFRLNVRVFLMGMALAIFFGVLSGAYPSWRMSRLHPVDALRGGHR